ncbi:Chaperone required for the assembly of the F1-ATPase [Faunimonas pinastri]|uniref:Chaperone required for the assembly of the F1-ATPase n=1 Tax=Faunimonas pinastri TaxID=1855383 RepID=A0A1H9KLX9_9HYPH|nr:ATP12 family protein [Faunimonas pinastri]SER00154.1 Chaperone required for the assembly of the F1-ATPase [Faunimonas pinastri]
MRDSEVQDMIDPQELARRQTVRSLPKRFYSDVTTVEEDGMHSVRLDGSPALTPARKRLASPSAVIASAMAEEWESQRETIDPATMPVTRLASTALDGVVQQMAGVREAILAYAGADLLLYRAGHPEELTELQRQVWDPVIRWAEGRYAVRLLLAEGVTFVTQPAETLAAIGEALASVQDPFELTALHMATTLTGSALLALALREGFLPGEDIWNAGNLDEDWNVRQWGEDAEAAERRDRRHLDFKAAELVLGQGSSRLAP